MKVPLEPVETSTATGPLISNGPTHSVAARAAVIVVPGVSLNRGTGVPMRFAT